MGDVYMVNGEILHGFVNHAKDQEFDNTGTGLSSTNAEDAIKEVNSNLIKVSGETALGTRTVNGLYDEVFNCPSDKHCVGIAGSKYSREHEIINTGVFVDVDNQKIHFQGYATASKTSSFSVWLLYI